MAAVIKERSLEANMLNIAISTVLSHRKRMAPFVVGGICAVLLAGGCSAAPGDQRDSDKKQIELDASDETVAAFAIDKWQVLAANTDGVRIVGRDGEGHAIAEFLVGPKERNSVIVQSLSPHQGTLSVGDDGSIEAGGAASLRQLVGALYRDTGHPTKALIRNVVDDRAIGNANEALSIGYSGHEAMYGGWFGLRVNYNVAGWCPNGGVRSHYSSFSDYGSSCWINRWASDQQNDCTINLHLGIGAFSSDVCHWYVYQTP
jgi:hypothetical protein